MEQCPNCGGEIFGDGYTTVQYCENADPPNWLEPDTNPVLCNYKEESTND